MNHTINGSDGVRLHVEEAGNPAGKPILFIHGFSQCSLVWRKQMQSELADEFRLVAVDIRGHGRSDKPRDAYGDSKLWADDVHAVIRQLDLMKPLVVGWSYGGAIVSDYIGSYGEDEISGVNLVAAVCRLGEPLVAPGFAGENFLAEVPGFFSDSVDKSVQSLEKLIGLCVPSGLSSEDRYLLLGCNMVVPPHVREGLLSRTLDNDAIVRNVRKPLLLTWSEEDPIIPATMRDHIARLAPHSRVSTYPEKGHAPFWSSAERFNRELREFRESV